MWVSKKKYALLEHQLKQADLDLAVLHASANTIIDAIKSLDAKVEQISKKKNVDNASYELREFLADVMEHGCGIIKIAPDSIFIRGLKS